VTATPVPPVGTTLDAVSVDEVVSVQGAAPALETLKVASTVPDPLIPGSVVVFDITVENTGNVSLEGVTLSDTLRRADDTRISPDPVATFVSGDGGAIDILDVDETWTYRVSHTMTQDDIDAGGLSNSVLARATDPFATDVEDLSDDGTGSGSQPTFVGVAPLPSVEAVKVITTSTIAVNETVTFEITVENTGNVTLSSVDVISDTLTRNDGANTPLVLSSGPDFVSATMGSVAGTLLVDEIATYRASYVLQQADVDAGGITNTATAQGTAPGGETARDITDNGTSGSGGDDPTVLEIPADPSVALVKSLQSGGPTFETLNQELVFAFEVTNTGNVTLTDPITITDALITDAGQTISCPLPPLAPQASLTCTASYFVTQDDLDTGSLTNTDVTVPATQLPSLEMGKVADEITSANFIVGAVASYTYTVTNTGNVTVTDLVTITDNRIEASDIQCPVFPIDGLAPGAEFVCTASYVVTVDDVALGSVTNNASATDGTVVSPLVSETIPVDGTPALSIDKVLTAVNGDTGLTSFAAVDDILTYGFTVTNSGEVSFSNDITVIDPLIEQSPITCFTSTVENPDLIPGETTTCQGTYRVTQADLDAGEVFNEATASTEFGVGPTVVTSPAGTETTPAATQPQIALVKSVATLPVTDVGQVLTYTLTITNVGNQTLTSISGSDPLLPNLSCAADTLAPGAELVCSDTYAVTQDDVDAGTLVNNADVSAINPQGDSIVAEDQLITDMPAADPAFTLVKSANPDPYGGLGTAVLYTFTVQNTGNVTLSDVTVTDSIVDPAFSCTVPSLGVGQTDNSCTLSYVVTQDDVDAGQIVNTATAIATDPFGAQPVAEDTNTANGPDAAPALLATKTASVGGTAVGSVVTYTLRVENNVFDNTVCAAKRRYRWRWRLGCH